MNTPICIVPGCGDRVEIIDDWASDYCPKHNDTLIERANARWEWDYYHNDPENQPSKNPLDN
jgi:hypothetical protein